MNLEISHSTTGSTYSIFCGKFLLGAARKTEDGFLGETLFGDVLEASTMKALKEAFATLADSLEGLKQHLVAKPYYITVDDARKIGGLSHSAIATRIKELHKFHPYLRGEQYGAAILKQAFEAQARWDWGKWERQWLIDNAAKLPHLKTVDDAWFERTGQVRYL